MVALWTSAICSGLSLFLGYKLKGSVVTALKITVSAKQMSIPDTAGYDGLAQFVLFLLGIFIFVGALGWKSEIVAKALIDTVRGK